GRMEPAGCTMRDIFKREDRFARAGRADAFRRAQLDARSRHGRACGVRSSSGIQTRSSLERPPALVAQLDRAPDFESGGRGFESLRARSKSWDFLSLIDNRGHVPKSSRDAAGTQTTFSGRETSPAEFKHASGLRDGRVGEVS